MTKYIHGFRVKQAQGAPEKKIEKIPDTKLRGIPEPVVVWKSPEDHPKNENPVLGVTETKAGKRSYAIVSFKGGEWKGTAAKVVAWMDLPLMPA